VSAALWSLESRSAANGSSAALSATLAASGRPAVSTSVEGSGSLSTAPRVPVPDHVRRLTTRDIRVIELVSLGLPTAEIARVLDAMAASTLAAHMRRLLWALDASNRAALVAAGFRFGLLSPRPWPPGVPPPPLKPLQAGLLPLIAEGLTDECIADRLPSSVPVYAPAVRSRMAVLRQALGASSRSHVVRLAVEAGLLVVSADGSRLVLADHVSGGMS
jgi:DNA-binding NarL/FixJ family response regulator